MIRRVQPGPSGRVETLAGTGVPGSQDGSLTTAAFSNPQGIAIDNSRNLWVADSGNHTIRKVNLVAGTVSTVAGLAGSPGSADGTGSQARFNSPIGIAVQTETVGQQLDLFRHGGPPATARLIVADTGNGLIRGVKVTGEVETILAPAFAAAAMSDSKNPSKVAVSAPPLRFDAPTGVAVDQLGNIYITEENIGRLKAILRTGSLVSVLQLNTVRSPKGLLASQFGRVVVSDGSFAAKEINYGAPEILSISPEPVSGAVITIKGKNFAPESIVIASGVLVTSFEVRDTETIVLTVPPLAGGAAATLTVLNRGGLRGVLTSDLTLKASDTPHTLVGNLAVSANVKLLLEPGVELKAVRNTVIAVNGSFVARGSAAAPIRFTSASPAPQPGDWVGLVFTDTSADAQFDSAGNYVSGSILENVVIEYTGVDVPSGGSALSIDDSSPFLNNLTVRNNRGTGIYVRHGSPRIVNSRITNNRAGINAVDPGNITLKRNTITNNAGDGVVLQAFPDGAYVDLSQSHGVASVTENVIANNEGGGLRVDGLGTFTISKNIVSANKGVGIDTNTYNGTASISGNVLQGNLSGGIVITAKNSTITDNVITNNKSTGSIINNKSTGRGAGLRLSNDTNLAGAYGTGPATAVVRNNIISNNTASVSAGGVFLELLNASGGLHNTTIQNNLISGNVAPLSSGLEARIASTGAVSGNTFTQNRSTTAGSSAISIVDSSGAMTWSQNNWFNNDAAYTLAYDNANTSPALNVANNWWGTADNSAIQGLIYDFNDDSGRGLVTYTPALASANLGAPVSPPSGLQVAAGTNSLTLNWTANPESDVSGYKIYYDTDPNHLYTGAGATQGASPIDAGKVTTYTLTGLAPGTYYVSVTAYDTGRDNSNDQTDGNESWFALEESAIAGGTGVAPSATLVVTRSGAGNGSISSAPAGVLCGIDCAQAYANGATVTLSATTGANSTFAGWSGACTGT